MKQYKERSHEAFNRQAAVYDTSAYGSHARALYPVLLAQLAQIPNQRVLDVGCGTGELLRLVLQARPRTRCAGLDLSEKMLSVAKGKLGEGAELVQGDAEKLPFEDGAFDAVLCCDSFHHYPQPEAALAECRRVLAPGGVYLLADTTAPGVFRWGVNAVLPLSREGDVHLYGAREVKALLSRHFCGVEYRPVSATSFLAWGIRREGAA